MRCKSVHSHGPAQCDRYNRGVFPVPSTARTTRRRLTMRAATFLLTAIVTVVGLWGVSHADELGIPAPAASSTVVTATAFEAAVGHIVDIVGETVGEEAVLGIVTCLLGILCGFALAVLIHFALRFRQVRFQRQRSQIAPIAAAAAFDHRGRHRFGLHHLSLLRI